MSLARRSVTSTAWNVVANMTRLVVLFGRSVLLARWLPVQVFGIYALANSILIMSAVLANFGLGGAFMHRAPETEDEDQAAASHFTLKLVFISIWAIVLTFGALLLTSGDLRLALLVLVFVNWGIELTQTPQLILQRRVVHRRLALLEVCNAVVTTVVALGLAMQGVELWALLATDIATLLLKIFMLYVWRPVWRLRLMWSPPVVRYFLSFGARTFLAGVLLRALNQVDDLWTGYYLGSRSMGYYSRAYSFATYPRTVIGLPINAVVGGTYAELKGQRKRLSQAFFRSNALLVRSGFFLAGLLSLVAPEFIRLLLGAKWLPMLDAFRLMLVFTLFDPLKNTVASLFVAVGHPGRVVQARLLQLIVLIAGLYSLGFRWDIAGVAIAVDLMLAMGIGLLFWLARAHVDYSLRRMFGIPFLSLLTGYATALATMQMFSFGGNDWLTGAVKASAFCFIYLLVTVLFEWKRAIQLLNMFKEWYPKRT